VTEGIPIGLSQIKLGDKSNNNSFPPNDMIKCVDFNSSYPHLDYSILSGFPLSIALRSNIYIKQLERSF
jgi:hypothetical protein